MAAMRMVKAEGSSLQEGGARGPRRQTADAAVGTIAGPPQPAGYTAKKYAGWGASLTEYRIVNGKVQTRALEYHVADHCNLHCDHCCSFSPILKKWLADPATF